MNLYINVNAQSPRKALVASATSNTPVEMSELTFGDNRVLQIYLTDGDGNWLDYTATHTIKVAIGTPGLYPTDGDYKFLVSGATSANCPIESTAAQVSSILNALPEVSTPGGVSVSGVFPFFQFTWVTDGIKPVIYGTSESTLIPESLIYERVVTPGDTGVYQVQTFRAVQTPPSYQWTWAAGTKLWSANMRMDTTQLSVLFPANTTEIDSYIEVQLATVATDEIQTILQAECKIRADMIG